MEKENNNKTFEEQQQQVSSDIRSKWELEQIQLASKVIERPLIKPKYVAGLDISFSKQNQDIGFACIVIVDITTMSVVYSKVNEVQLTQPYIPGFLAFREVEHYKALITPIKNEIFYPEVVLMDGNGKFHTRRCGIATHLGVELGIPTIGCAKTVFAVDGITSDTCYDLSLKLVKRGQYIKLKRNRGKNKSDKEEKEVLGALVSTYLDERYWDYNFNLKNYDFYDEGKTPNDPIIVSTGNLIDLDSAIDIVVAFNPHNQSRVPLPVDLADQFSRKAAYSYDKKKKQSKNITNKFQYNKTNNY